MVGEEICAQIPSVVLRSLAEVFHNGVVAYIDVVVHNIEFGCFGGAAERISEQWPGAPVPGVVQAGEARCEISFKRTQALSCTAFGLNVYMIYHQAQSRDDHPVSGGCCEDNGETNEIIGFVIEYDSAVAGNLIDMIGHAGYEYPLGSCWHSRFKFGFFANIAIRRELCKRVIWTFREIALIE